MSCWLLTDSTFGYVAVCSLIIRPGHFASEFKAKALEVSDTPMEACRV